MNITNGLLIIVLLTFIISMLVATIIWLLSLSNPNSGLNRNASVKKQLINFLKDEVRHFQSFQVFYRTYWYKDNAPTNELISFYHEP